MVGERKKVKPHLLDPNCLFLEVVFASGRRQDLLGADYLSREVILFFSLPSDLLPLSGYSPRTFLRKRKKRGKSPTAVKHETLDGGREGSLSRRVFLLSELFFEELPPERRGMSNPREIRGVSIGKGRPIYSR